MKCRKCKNPIDINDIECEWCGMLFSNNSPTPTSGVPIKAPVTSETSTEAAWEKEQMRRDVRMGIFVVVVVIIIIIMIVVFRHYDTIINTI